MAVNLEKTLQSAQQFVERGDFERALGEYAQLLAVDPSDTRVLLRVGDLHTRAGNLPAALQTYDQAAGIYAAGGLGLKAVAVYRQVWELALQQPGLADRYIHVVERLTALFLELGLLNDALRTLDEEATRLRNAEREDESVALLRRMTDIAANVPLPYLRLGEGLYRVGQTDEALGAFWSATQLLLAGGRSDDALRVIERMLHIKPLPRHAKIAARLYLEKGTEPEGKQALSRLQICFQADPTDLETVQMLSQAFDQIGQAERAVEVLKEFTRLAHDQGRADLFAQGLQTLRERSPDDPQVETLAQLPASGSRSAAPASSIPPSRHSPPPKPADHHSSTRAPRERSVTPPPKPAGRSMRPGASEDGSVPPSAAFHSAPAHSPPSSAPPSANLAVPVSAPASAPAPPSSRGKAPPLPGHFARSKPPPLPAHFRAAASQMPPPRTPPSKPSMVPPAAHDDAGAWLESQPPAPLAVLPEVALRDHAALSEANAPNAERLTSPGGDGTAAASGALDPEASLANTRRALADAKAFRSLSLFHKAIETVQSALDVDGRSIELRELLRDLFTDVGDRDGAIDEMLAMAEIYVEFGRPDHARAVLENILQEESQCAPAREMLDALAAEGERFSEPLPLVTPHAPSAPTAAALPSQASQTSPGSRPSPGSQPSPTSQPSQSSGASSELSASLLPPAPPGMTAPSRPRVAPPPPRSNSLAPPPPRPSSAPPLAAAPPPPPMSVEETLEEVDFFSSRGMLAEAERLLKDQLQRYPDHPLLLDSLEELREAILEGNPSEDVSSKLQDGQPKPSDSLDFDLRAELGELGRAVRASLLPPDPNSNQKPVDVDGLFDRFKQSVKQQVADGDNRTHYDLGVAYKDMHLLDDAVEELQLASRDPGLECKSQSLIGAIYAEQNIWDKASKAYARALSAVRKSKEEETQLYYELGQASEMQGQADQAVYYFRQVLRRNQEYRDTRSRVAELRTRRHRTASGRPRGADEEVDRAFEDIIGD